ncbi:MAG: nucleotidyl transferase AbiEii/AbiGii toxin family protein [Armatimonadaceae bacterium]
MTWLNSDFSELLSLFNEYQVKYLVIGGYAVVRYTEPRFTKDLDLWVSADAENAQAVFGALKAFGAPLANLTKEDFAAEGYFYQMGVPPLRVDVLMSIPGVVFADAWERREEIEIDGLRIAFISRTDLIASKQASARPQDIIDVQMLLQAESLE